MKKLLALALAVLMCVALAACGGNGTTTPPPADTTTPAPDTTPAETNEFSGDVTLRMMVMPQGDMTSDGINKVTEAVNARIAELGYEFKMQFAVSGVPWNCDELDTALQTGDAPDIFPAHGWSGSVTLAVGAMNGQYLRLDDPENNLLEKYGSAIYATTAPAFKAAATIPGNKGVGIYNYNIEKDGVSTLGYFVNKTVLEELGFTLADFKADDIASWEPILAAYKAAYPNKYPLNIEGEVLDRTVNHIVYIGGTTSPIGFEFDNSNPNNYSLVSRYESSGYKNFINTMHNYYTAKYVDPDQGIAGAISSESIQARRDSGDYLISTFVYTPGQEVMYSTKATEGQGRDIEIAFVPGWSSPIGDTGSLTGSGLAVSAGTKYAPEAVTFLNMLASDAVIANLMAEGIEGESYEVRNGVAFRTADRGGWAPWRYGLAGSAAPLIPLGDIDPDGNELKMLKDFNTQAIAVAVGFMFDNTPVDAENAACVSVVDKFVIPLGTGAVDPAQYDAFITELKAVGLDAVLAEATSQYNKWASEN